MLRKTVALSNSSKFYLPCSFQKDASATGQGNRESSLHSVATEFINVYFDIIKIIPTGDSLRLTLLKQTYFVFKRAPEKLRP